MSSHVRKAVLVAGILSVGLASHVSAYSNDLHVENKSICDLVTGGFWLENLFTGSYWRGAALNIKKGGSWSSDAWDSGKTGVYKIEGYCRIEHNLFFELFRLIPYKQEGYLWYRSFEIAGSVKGRIRVVPVKSSAYFPAEK